MRAREFVINIPITVRIDGEGKPKISKSAPPQPKIPAANQLPPKEEDALDDEPVMVPPLQQEIELKKAAAGKTSPTIQNITQDEIEASKKITTVCSQAIKERHVRLVP